MDNVLLAVIGLIGTAVTGICYRLITLVSSVLAQNTQAIHANTQAMNELKSLILVLATQEGVLMCESDSGGKPKETPTQTPWKRTVQVRAVSHQT